MLSHLTALLGLLSLVIVTISLREHARGLLDVARTYASFRDLITQNPDVLFQYPLPAQIQHSSGPANVMIPKLIHQIALMDGQANGSIARFAPAMQSCRALHTD
jgi:hypothetical protein